MEKQKLQKLKLNYYEFCDTLEKMELAKNKKEKLLIQQEMDLLKNQIIKEFELMNYDKHIYHYRCDNQYFKDDIEDIILKLEKE